MASIAEIKIQHATPRPGGIAWVLLGLLFAFSLALPFVLKGYVVFQATMVLAYAAALLGLNLLIGFNGQISLGHGAFFAIGSYAMAILVEQAGLHYAVALVLTALVCLLVGYLFGLPALKLEGLYLALATFALAVATPQLLKHRVLEPWTGGAQGIAVSKPEPPPGIPLDSDQWLYLLSLFVFIVLFVLARNALKSGVGRAVMAIREHALAAETMGVDIRGYKALVFGISAMYTGIGGALAAMAVQFVAPDSFTLFLSITLLVGVVIGGASRLAGALYGAVFIMFVPSLAESISKDAPWAVYGVLLILVVFAAPGGIASLLEKLYFRMSPSPTRRVDPP